MNAKSVQHCYTARDFLGAFTPKSSLFHSFNGAKSALVGRAYKAQAA